MMIQVFLTESQHNILYFKQKKKKIKIKNNQISFSKKVEITFGTNIEPYL